MEVFLIVLVIIIAILLLISNFYILAQYSARKLFGKLFRGRKKYWQIALL